MARLRSVLLVVLAGCDGVYAGFLNAVPVAEDENGGTTHVVLAIDGVARAAFDAARSQGAFAGWAAADLITPFPATSAYSWTRTFRTESLPGYEFEYFDTRRNHLVNDGLMGVAEHTIRHGNAGVTPCWDRFDFLGDGDLWMARGYTDPEAALPGTLREMFDTINVRGRRQKVFVAYLLNIDVISHILGYDEAVKALMEIGRQIEAFDARHPGRFEFTIVSDHGNTHQEAELVDLEEVLEEVGVRPVGSLSGASQLEAVPIIHVRVSYVALHARREQVREIARRLSTHRTIETAVAPLGGEAVDGERAERYGLWHEGRRVDFLHLEGGDVLVPDVAAWRALGVDLGVHHGSLRLGDREAFDRTREGPWPDVFHQVHGAFTAPAVEHRADLIVSMPDDVSSYGFRIPGGADRAATAGFHGSLSRASTLSVVATNARPLPEALRSQDLAHLFPEIVEK